MIAVTIAVLLFNATLLVEPFENVIELEQDAGPPNRCVGALSSKLQQKIPLDARDEGAGIEDGLVHPMSVAHASGALRSPGLASRCEERVDVFEIHIAVPRGTLGDEGVSATLDFVPVGQHIGEIQLAAHGARYVSGNLS